MLVSDTGAPPGEDTLLSTGDLDFDFQPGLRLTVGWQPDPCRSRGWCSAWELSYLGLLDWDAFGLFNGPAEAAATGDNNLAIPGVLGLISNNYYMADEIRAAYDSELHSFEWNCVKSCCFDCRTQIDFLCGFRFLTLQEDFALVGTRSAGRQRRLRDLDRKLPVRPAGGRPHATQLDELGAGSPRKNGPVRECCPAASARRRLSRSAPRSCRRLRRRRRTKRRDAGGVRRHPDPAHYQRLVAADRV